MTGQSETARKLAECGPSRHAIAGWTTAMLAALALAWFVGAVAVPAWRIRAVVARCHACGPDPEDLFQAVVESGREKGMFGLGAPAEAAAKLKFYLRLPDWAAPHKVTGVRMLCWCGQDAKDCLRGLLNHRDQRLRLWAAAMLLASCTGDAPEAESGRQPAVRDGDGELRREALRVLSEREKARLSPQERRDLDQWLEPGEVRVGSPASSVGEEAPPP